MGALSLKKRAFYNPQFEHATIDILLEKNRRALWDFAIESLFYV